MSGYRKYKQKKTKNYWLMPVMSPCGTHLLHQKIFVLPNKNRIHVR